MARLSYSAPGVYVEEIPSARQPIAGVGTNTAGFIGIVPDTVHIPEPNPNYDPILAQNMLDYLRLIEESKNADALRLSLEAILNSQNALVEKLGKDVEKLTEDQKKARTNAEDMQKAVTDLPAAASEDDKTKANKAVSKAHADLINAAAALKKATAEQKATTDERDGLKTKLEIAKTAAPTAAPGSSGSTTAATPKVAEAEDFGYDSATPEQFADLLVPSKFRPYYLVPFPVKAEEFATKLCTNFSEYANLFGGFSAFKGEPENPDAPPSAWTFKPLYPGHHLLTHAVDGFFRNGGTRCFVARVKRIDDWARFS